ncbi:MAG: DnaJ domain-containing protein, partial [Gammaproteobacteria bacterium]|nr:DnaJ domain-containing protein [Gammaproteobacteria bacterium]
MNITHQLQTLCLQHPFTEQELTHAYRVRAFETHPDRNGGKNDQAFKAVQEAYKLLLPMCVLANEKDIVNSRTIEGQNIFDLGKGLGDIINSIDCSECQGKGWYEYTHTGYGDLQMCPVCDGAGQVRTTSNSVLWWKAWRPCRRCRGFGHLGFTEIKHRTLHTCSKCNGTGQI